jgi:hypothetical protein
MRLYQFTTEELEEQCNTLRRILIHKLNKDGLISQETYEDYMLNVAFIIRKPSLFNTFWNTVLKQKDQTSYIMVRQDSFVDDMNEDPEDPENNKKAKFEVIDLDKHKK